MKIKTIVMSLVTAALAYTPLLAAPALNSGNYQAQINPPVDGHTASNIEKAMDGIQEIDQIKVAPGGNAVQFHVKDNQSVDYARIQQAVQAAAPNEQLPQLTMLSGAGAATAAATSGASGTSSPNGAITLQQNGVSYTCSPQH